MNICNSHPTEWRSPVTKQGIPLAIVSHTHTPKWMLQLGSSVPYTICGYGSRTHQRWFRNTTGGLYTSFSDRIDDAWRNARTSWVSGHQVSMYIRWFSCRVSNLSFYWRPEVDSSCWMDRRSINRRISDYFTRYHVWQSLCYLLLTCSSQIQPKTHKKWTWMWPRNT